MLLIKRFLCNFSVLILTSHCFIHHFANSLKFNLNNYNSNNNNSFEIFKVNTQSVASNSFITKSPPLSLSVSSTNNSELIQNQDHEILRENYDDYDPYDRYNSFLYVKKNNNTLKYNSSLTRESLNNSTLFDTVFSVPLLLLLSQNNYTNPIINDNNDNDTTSESRTLGSWLGLRRFRKPQRKDRPTRLTSNHPQVPQLPPPPFPPGPFLTNLFPRPDGFPGPDDPDAVLLPPSLFEESGIKHWLKFIENGGNIDDLQFHQPTRKPIFVENNNKRRKTPVKHAESITMRPIQIGEKPKALKQTFFHENSDMDSNDHKDSSGQDSSIDTHKYDTSPRCDKFTNDICVDDFEYPEQAIVDEIYKRRDIFELMYSEVRGNEPLVDGIPRDVEESYNYEHYYNQNDYDSHSSGSEYTDKSSTSTDNFGGFICPSEVLYGRPKLARNKKGDWKVIVNAAEFTQTIRMEKCIKPNNKCNHISSSEFNSRCAQVHSFHRLMVFEKGKGFYIDTFRMPTACTCHINRRMSYKPVQSEDNYDKKQNQQALSNTLWSILGGSNGNMETAQSSIRDHLNLLNQLKNFPQFSAQISPESVLQQLMDLQSPSSGQKHSSNSHLSSDNAHHSTMEYILPSLLGENSNNQQLANLAKVQQTPTTTTYVNPSGNGAPVVQVIHVPVTSNLPSGNQPAPVYRASNQPSFSRYVDVESILSKKKSNSDEIIDSFRPLLLQMQTKTNSTLYSPNRKESKIDLDAASTKTKNISDEERRKDIHSSFNKKINFSYHPILDYIST